MTPVSNGVMEAQARIAQIKAEIAAIAPRPAARASAPAEADFASALGRAETQYSTQGVRPGDVVTAAAHYLGVPYRWGGTDPATGLDCSGFVQQVYEDLGIKLPRVSRDQAKTGTAVADLASAQPGDLVAFGTPVDHIGIYIGQGRMMVAPHTGDVVKVQDVPSDWTAIRRVLPDGGTGSSFIGAAGGVSSYSSLFEAAGQRYGVPANVLAAVARAESGGNPNAVSRAGAQGLMQLMPATARGLGVDPFNPSQAVDGAARILSGNLQRFGGSLPLALAAYNAGAGAVTKYGGIPPYRETQGYVNRILDELRSEAP